MPGPEQDCANNTEKSETPLPAQGQAWLRELQGREDVAKNSPNPRVFSGQSLLFFILREFKEEMVRQKSKYCWGGVSNLLCLQDPGYWIPVFFEDQVA